MIHTKSLLMMAAVDGTEGAASAAAPVAAPGSATSMQFSFHFRTDKIRDDEGKVIGTGRKHPSVEAPLPIPTYNQLIEQLQAGGKEAEMILDAVVTMIDTAARGQINDWREANGLDKDFTATNFDLGKLTLTAIANTPKADRAGAAISDEDWTGFLDDYTHVMTQVVGYDPKKVKLHATHLKVQLRRIKNDKNSVAKLLEFLNVWAAKTEALDDHVECYNDLVKRANKYLKAEEKDLSAAL